MNIFSATASRFAHLAGIGRRPSAAEDDKDKKDKEASAAAEDDEEDEDEQAAEDDREEEAARSEGDDESTDDDEKKDGKKGKGNKAAGDNEDERCEDDEEKEKAAFRRGRLAERKRWSAVLGSRAAAANVQLAVTLLADTSKKPEHIVGRLTEASRSGVGSSARRDRNPSIDTGAQTPNGGASASQIAKSWDAQFAKHSRKR